MARTVEITSNHVNELNGKSAKTGNPFRLRLQQCWLFSDDQYPKAFEILLKDDQMAYSAGFYYLDEKSIVVDRMGKIQIVPTLTPGATAPKKNP